jgi:predicted GNAT family acetyltransferase
MRVTRHTDPDAFLESAEPMEHRGEASASFFAISAHSLKRTPAPADERVYLATCHDGAARGVAVQRGEGPVVVGQSDPEAAAAFAADLAAEWPELHGVVGARAACEAFAQRWRDLTGRGHLVRVHLRQHALMAVTDVPAAVGSPRTADDADFPWLFDAHVAFINEVAVPDSAERIRSSLPARIARGDLWIWDDEGRAAFAGYNDAAPAFARVAPVYTLPDRRGRGYATALVAALSRELIARGKRKLFLTTDAANPTSNAIYARIGFVAETDEYGFDFVDPAA